MATIYVPRQQNPWIQALQNIAVSYLGGQLQAGLERTKAAQNFEAQKAVYDAMAAQGQQAGGQPPAMYDIAPGAVASRASEAMTGTGTPYAPETVSPEQMYHKLLTSGQGQIPTEADLISRGLGAKGAPKVGFENILKLAAAVNAQYEPQRKAQQQAAAEQKVRDLIPSGGDLRNDPNTLAQVGTLLQANGYDPEKVFKYAFANKSFEKLDLDDRTEAGAFDPVTGRADMTTYKKGINPTDLMKEKAATGRTAMTQREKWVTEKGADGVLYRVNPATGEAAPVKGVTLAEDNPKWTDFVDINGDQWRLDLSTGKTERTGLKGAPETDPARKEAVEVVGAIAKLYPLGIDENTPPETAAAAANAMAVLTGSASKNAYGSGFRFTDQQRQKLRDMGYDDDQIAAEEKRRTGN